MLTTTKGPILTKVELLPEPRHPQHSEVTNQLTCIECGFSSNYNTDSAVPLQEFKNHLRFFVVKLKETRYAKENTLYVYAHKLEEAIQLLTEHYDSSTVVEISSR